MRDHCDKLTNSCPVVLGSVHSANRLPSESVKSLLLGVNKFLILATFPISLQAVQFSITFSITSSVSLIQRLLLAFFFTCMAESQMDIFESVSINLLSVDSFSINLLITDSIRPIDLLYFSNSLFHVQLCVFSFTLHIRCPKHDLVSLNPFSGVHIRLFKKSMVTLSFSNACILSVRGMSSSITFNFLVRKLLATLFGNNSIISAVIIPHQNLNLLSVWIFFLLIVSFFSRNSLLNLSPLFQ